MTLLLVIGLGTFLLFSPLALGDLFLHLSFDIPFLFAPAAPPNDVTVIKFDESTLSDPAVNGGTELRDPVLPRSAYARLLTNVAADGARLVIFDVLLKGKTT